MTDQKVDWLFGKCEYLNISFGFKKRMVDTEYTFDFVNAYSDEVFATYVGATPKLGEMIRGAAEQLKKVLTLNPGINCMSTQVASDDKLFKVRISRDEPRS